MPIYGQVLFENKMIANQVSRVVIEGHTSAYGKSDENMKLSLLRSWEVANYTLYKMPFPNKEHKKQLEEKIMISGRGENDATKPGDFAGDRKVTLRLELKGKNYEGLLKNSSIELQEVKQ
jgi:outer membrane protein OmpA-like peptidoglycan-associated protein